MLRNQNTPSSFFACNICMNMKRAAPSMFNYFHNYNLLFLSKNKPPSMFRNQNTPSYLLLTLFYLQNLKYRF